MEYCRLLAPPFLSIQIEEFGGGRGEKIFVDILISFYCCKTIALMIKKKMNMNILVRYVKIATNKFKFVYLYLYYQNIPKVSKKFLYLK